MQGYADSWLLGDQPQIITLQELLSLVLGMGGIQAAADGRTREPDKPRRLGRSIPDQKPKDRLAIVAQTFQSAVSRVFQPAGRGPVQTRALIRGSSLRCIHGDPGKSFTLSWGRGSG
jgi:hypothetical protein